MSSSISKTESSVDDGPKLIKILTTMAVVVTVVVALRIFMKIRRQYRIDFEDWLCLAAVVGLFKR